MIVQDPKNDGYNPVTLEAHDLVFGDREESYGHPLDDFSCTALAWTAYLRRRGLLIEDDELVAEDVGPMMVMLKMIRQGGVRKRDNLVDGSGYCETTERVIFERARRARITQQLIADLEERREAQKGFHITMHASKPTADLHEDTFRDLLERH